jgi:hypothetical protein
VTLPLVSGGPAAVDPIVGGGGKRIFRDDGSLRALHLIDSQVTTTGAILATYARRF